MCKLIIYTYYRHSPKMQNKANWIYLKLLGSLYFLFHKDMTIDIFVLLTAPGRVEIPTPSYIKQTTSSAFILWHRPLNPNGKIKAYRAVLESGPNISNCRIYYLCLDVCNNVSKRNCYRFKISRPFWFTNKDVYMAIIRINSEQAILRFEWKFYQYCSYSRALITN